MTATSKKDDNVQSTLKNGLSNLSKAFVCCWGPKSFRGIVSIVLGLELYEERDSVELLLVQGWAFAVGVGLSVVYCRHYRFWTGLHRWFFPYWFGEDQFGHRQVWLQVVLELMWVFWFGSIWVTLWYPSVIGIQTIAMCPGLIYLCYCEVASGRGVGCVASPRLVP